MGKHVTWDFTHNPEKPVLGCTGKQGDAGRNWHKRQGTPACDKCKAAANWTARERRRGQPHPRELEPCGTFAAATRHRNHNEDLDLACRVAEARYHADLRELKRDAENDNSQLQRAGHVPAVSAETPPRIRPAVDQGEGRGIRA